MDDLKSSAYSVGLLELIPPLGSQPRGSPTRKISEWTSAAISRGKSRLTLNSTKDKDTSDNKSRASTDSVSNGDDVTGAQLTNSMIEVINNKLLELAISMCKTRLFITYSGKVTTSLLRVKGPEIYNTIWDMSIHQEKMDLDCIVLLGGVAGLKSKMDLLEDETVDVVFNCGPRFDSSAITEKTLTKLDKSVKLLNLEDEIQHTAVGDRFFLYNNPGDTLPKAEIVAMGGTFDNLHNGHKNILSVALYVCTKKLVVGVTSDEILSKKQHAELILPYNVRRDRMCQFIRTMTRGRKIEVEVHKIVDRQGPATDMKDIGVIVVSSETIDGAKEINRERRRKGMSTLDIVAVMRSNIHTLSSTFIRSQSKSNVYDTDTES